MKQLAICVPIYNQPEMLREMLVRCLAIYEDFGIDIYIYDSSPGNETEAVIQEYSTDYHNLYYRHLSADIYSNIKVLEAYREIIGMKKYEYLWLCPDYIQLTRQGTELVTGHCGEEFDIFVLNYRDVERIGEKCYTDLNTFFLECAWHMSSYMATVIRLSSFADIQWEQFYERYTIPERICHSHVALYFEQLAKLPKVKAFHLPISSVHMRVSSYRKESLWKKEVFPIWCEHWPNMIHALPGGYQYKEDVIKKLGVNTGIFGREHFINLREEDIYDRNIYLKYQSEWKRLTDVPVWFLWMLSRTPPHMAVIFRRPNLKQRLLHRKLRNFCSRHTEVWIYGCGFMAQKTKSVLDKLSMEYQGYIVSDRSSEKKSFQGLPVIECGELPAPEPKVGIIVALNQTNAVQVMREKQELCSYDVFYMYPYEGDL